MLNKKLKELNAKLKKEISVLSFENTLLKARGERYKKEIEDLKNIYVIPCLEEIIKQEPYIIEVNSSLHEDGVFSFIYYTVKERRIFMNEIKHIEIARFENKSDAHSFIKELVEQNNNSKRGGNEQHTTIQTKARA